MKILVAMDEFNGIISSYQVNRYVEEAIASQMIRQILYRYLYLTDVMNY